NYDSFAEYKSGVRFDFAVFSLFPTLYLLFIKVTRVINISELTLSFYKIYSLLLIPFWFLGWGNYSNRYAMPAWLLYFVVMLFPLVKLKRFSVGVVLLPLALSLVVFLLFLYFKVIM
ncbi:hypothetical protein, partial [Shewanella sp. BJSY2023SW001]|uniref:hypothetical protein n=1 Tax=Shewanella sp. BJSY2023SW001 TaxID=3392039 RepID=UPI0039B4204F